MTASFTFSDKEDAKFPDHCQASMQVWADICKTIAKSDEVGTGSPNIDGTVKIFYRAFEITLMPDGTFSGKRRTGSDNANMTRVNLSPTPPSQASKKTDEKATA